MRDLILSLIFVGAAGASVPVSALAGVLAKEITTQDAKSAEALVLLQKKCKELSFTMISARKTCETMLAKHAIFSPTTLQFCLDHDASSLEFCLPAVVGFEVDQTILDLCSKMKDISRWHSGRANCVEYFSRSQSFYDTEAILFCVSGHKKSFRGARNCLNIIRDREFDLEKLKAACQGKAPQKVMDYEESFDECVEKALNSAPLQKDMICRSGTVSSNSSSNRQNGTQ